MSDLFASIKRAFSAVLVARCATAPAPHTGVERLGARGARAALGQPHLVYRAAKLARRSHPRAAVHDLEGHARNPATRSTSRSASGSIFPSNLGRSLARLWRAISSACAPCFEQYRDISGGKLQLSILDPEPFSDAEDSAVAAGLKGVRLNQEGEVGYFGLVGIERHRQRVDHPLLLDRSRTVPRIRRDQADLHAGKPEEAHRRPDHLAAARWRQVAGMRDAGDAAAG